MDASELRYDDLVDRVEVQYYDRKYRAAADLVDAESDGLEAWAAELAHLKACLLGASGDADGALRVLLDASAAGAWWRPAILTEDDDLAGLQDRPEFQELVRVSEPRVTDDPAPPVIDLPDQAAVGVVVALHGAGQTASHARRDWNGVLDLGYALICVQSSRRMSPKYRTWPDRDQAAADIAKALTEAQTATGLQLANSRTRVLGAGRVPVVAAGFSAGGRAAVDWALTGRPVPVAGVLAMAPALRELPAGGTPLSPATIWIGAEDDLLETVEGSADQLKGFTIEPIPGLGHAFPADFADRLAAVL
ncbi:phospholipase [Kribbella sp. NPDC051936]|uniref:phospholipase n=1 Tax=Kribbella sp. NPDC051936 TaxID=3154946 RepID=UPI00343FD2BC